MILFLGFVLLFGGHHLAVQIAPVLSGQAFFEEADGVRGHFSPKVYVIWQPQNLALPGIHAAHNRLENTSRPVKNAE